MKQRSSSPFEDKDVMEVAAILLELPHLFKVKHSDRVPVFSSWGTKRRRSIDDTSAHRRPSLSVPPPPVVQNIESKKPAVKGEASSPTTPLAFCHSESDDKTKPLKRKFSVKKTKAELLEMIKEYTENNQLLTKEIEQALRYREQLKERNMWLQTRKRELSLGTEQLQVEARADTRLTLVVDPSTSVDHGDQSAADRRPFIVGKNKWLNGSNCGTNENMGPSGIPDLNLRPPGEPPFWTTEFLQQQQAFEDMNKNITKAMAAQARFRRMQICRDKISASNLKLRLLHR